MNRRTRLIVLTLAVLTASVAACLGALGLARAEPSVPDPWRDRPIIVEVTGDAANGFGIEYAGGGGLYPPTDSEALAECAEYDAGVDRVRCRARFRTWYRDLGDLQRSLDYVRAHP